MERDGVERCHALARIIWKEWTLRSAVQAAKLPDAALDK